MIPFYNIFISISLNVSNFIVAGIKVAGNIADLIKVNIYKYIYIYINTIKSSCTECNKNNIDIQKNSVMMKTSVETFKR